MRLASFDLSLSKDLDQSFFGAVVMPLTGGGFEKSPAGRSRVRFFASADSKGGRSLACLVSAALAGCCGTRVKSPVTTAMTSAATRVRFHLTTIPHAPISHPARLPARRNDGCPTATQVRGRHPLRAT